MVTMLVSASLAVLLAGARPAAPAAAPAPADEPAITVSVPAACADVWQKVYTDLDRTWTVEVLPVGPEDERLPEPEVLDAFIARVKGLTEAVRSMDAVDRDVFFVRLKTRGLAELKKRYPKLDGSLLEAAKVESCRASAGK